LDNGLVFWPAQSERATFHSVVWGRAIPTRGESGVVEGVVPMGEGWGGRGCRR
jgi:hypothetical protein